MSAQVLQRDQLGELVKIGQGGQGVVYRAPKVTTAFSAAMVYKEYKARTLADIDFTVLESMPTLVEDALAYKAAERLISFAAWPCRIVENLDGPTGFVMPTIPDQFFIPLTTVKGTTSTTAEFQHLLNHATVLEARGVAIDEAQRYALLREVASALAFLHGHGVCVGDISPKNLLFSLSPHEAVYFIDCDAMRIDGASALPQVQTPGWETPADEELATIYSDTYKLGLLALRTLVGDQHSSSPAHLPSGTPDLVRQIIVDTLTNPPERRPLPQAWTYVLGHAIEHAQHQTRIAAATGAADVDVLAPPPQPVLHSRPTTRPPGPATPRKAAIATPPPPSAPPGPPAKGRRGLAVGLVVGAAIVVVGVTALVVNLSGGDSRSTESVSTTTYPAAAISTPSYPPSEPTYSEPEPTYTQSETTYSEPETTYSEPVPTYTPPPPEYAAIAVSDNGGYSWINNSASVDVAKSAVLNKCLELGGTCTVVAWGTCVALADGGNGARGWAAGSTLTEAERAAVAETNRGWILISFCAD